MTCNRDFFPFVTEKCRIYASISFAVLLLGVGLPLWWHTTEVPRVTLPYSGIKALDELEPRIHLKLYLGCLESHRAGLLANELLQLLTQHGHSEIFRMSLSQFVTGKTSIAKAKTIADLDQAVKKFNNFTYGDILLLEAPAGFESGHFVHVTSGRALYFSREADSEKIAHVLLQWIYREEALLLTKNALSSPEEYSLDEENRRRFPASPKYDVLLSIVNPDPESVKLNRDLSSMAQDYLEPFLEGLTPLADFSVKTQWLYLVPLGVEPKFVSEIGKVSRHYALSEDLLPQIITPLEKKLASQVSLHPTMNLVVYVVPCDNVPTYIYGRNGRRPVKSHDFEAFHSPRWGGIILVNPPISYCNRVNMTDEFQLNKEALVKVLLEHLRLLIGIADKAPIDGVSVEPLRGGKARSWEIDEALRLRSVEQLTSASLTLRSLSRLLRGIGNIVITDEVGSGIVRALAMVQHSAKLLDEADLVNGFLASKRAFIKAEAAFNDPSLLALLYFPDDQKYAVYIPLFLPVMIPVLFSLKNIKNYLFCSDE
ncbi:hypothetical protein QAD02_009849 [Eretmocerus hayati]|uniref:Uncharacterized protein n=1 Tax=Eretmocerus hayati TaxID=131215 RepID=A0ACC2NBW6_9HYME|nr:hypothetical protein QAD02_009849 [Eretmocerus hayati]